jgi:hypothetical protein
MISHGVHFKEREINSDQAKMILLFSRCRHVKLHLGAGMRVINSWVQRDIALGKLDKVIME